MYPSTIIEMEVGHIGNASVLEVLMLKLELGMLLLIYKRDSSVKLDKVSALYKERI